MPEYKSILVFGTRPELIKLAPVIIEYKNRGLRDNLIVINTNQHNHLLDKVIGLFEIDVNHTLDIDNMSNNLAVLSSEILKNLDTTIQNLLTDYNIGSIIVQGDTTTSYCASIVGFYNKIPIHYIEAGLRTYDISRPFPEEFHRISISHIASFLYAPTDSARQNLIKEGFDNNKILVTGNTIIDSLVLFGSVHETNKEASFNDIVLITMHRRENHGQRYTSIVRSLIKLAKNHSEYKFLLINHPNPDVQKVIDHFSSRLPSNMQVSNHLSYKEMLDVINKSKLIISDSGGLQEEASFFLKPMIILRDSTERVESIKSKIAVCLSPHKTLEQLFEEIINYTVSHSNKYLYGNGNAAKLIVDNILNQNRLLNRKP